MTAQLIRGIRPLPCTDFVTSVALLKSLSGWPLFGNEAGSVEKRKHGPKEKIDDEDLLRYWGGLIFLVRTRKAVDEKQNRSAR